MIESILQKHGLRATLPRRIVLEAMQQIGKPATQREISDWIQAQGHGVHFVTVYRILETFEKKHIVHRHPSSGGFTLCSVPAVPGHHDTSASRATCHGFLSCKSCGKVEEFLNEALATLEKRIAKEAGFISTSHINEIVGICSSCHS